MSQATDTTVLDAIDAMSIVFSVHNNEIPGRTVLHKLVYFASQKVPGSQIDFVPHYYGPFSPRVAANLADFCSSGCAYEIPVPRGDHRAYKCVLTDFGKEVADIAFRSHPKSTIDAIREIVNICESECKLRFNELSHAAKVHYSIKYQERRQKPKLQTLRDIHDVAYGIRWNLDEDDIRAGHALLRKLKLVDFDL